MIELNEIYQHDVRNTWPISDGSVDCIITSPPYWGLRDYLHKDQIGQEKTPEEYVGAMVKIFMEAFRVLKDSGTLWLNLADTYWGGKGQSGGCWKGESINGDAQNWADKGTTRPQDRNHPLIKPKDLVGIPWTVAIALRNAGFFLRQDIIWNKPNPMPESMADRCTKAHEYLFFLTKSRNYFFDQQAIMTPVSEATKKRSNQDIKNQTGSDRVPNKTNGNMKTVAGKKDGYSNKKSVWTVPTVGFDAEFCTSCHRYYEGIEKNQIKRLDGKDICICGRCDSWVEHFATFPQKLIEDCVKAGCPAGGLILDPFMGAGTTAMTALANGRNFLGFELNNDYINLARHRLSHHFRLFYTI